MRFKPLSNCILVERDTAEQTGSIILLSQKPMYTGVIKAAGPGKKLPKGNLEPMDVEVGDHIMFGEYTGQPVTVDGVEYLMMRANEAIGVL
jgi:chaperonin GroES